VGEGLKWSGKTKGASEQYDGECPRALPFSCDVRFNVRELCMEQRGRT